MYKQGRKLESKGKIVEAYLLYSQAAASNPSESKYWLRSQALRTRAATLAKTEPPMGVLAALPPVALQAAALEAAALQDPALQDTVTPPDPVLNSDPPTTDEMLKARELQSPMELAASPEVKDVDVRGDSKALFEQVARLYGLDVLFDGDYQAGQPFRFALLQVDYRTALHALMAATGSFLVPISPKLALVVQDTPQKRTEVENTVAVAIPIPDPVSAQDAQELARAVQQLMEIQKFGIDNTQRVVLMRDRISKVRPALELFRQLLSQKAQVFLEVEFVSLGNNKTREYGVSLPTKFPLVSFGKIWRSQPFIPTGFADFLTFGGGKTLFGLGLTSAQVFANMTEGYATSLMRAEMRSVDGQAATFHVGDKYPIQTSGYAGTISDQVDTYSFPPSFTFEDLGLTLKITPKVHGMDEVSLEVDAEFKALGPGSFNGIPIINNRKFTNRVRLRFGEWAVIAGLVNSAQVRTLSGLAGMSGIPVLGPLMSRTNTEKNESQTILVIKPRLVSSPTSELLTRGIWVGSEGRPLSPL